MESAYENNNASVGLACGFSGIAQIGKGMGCPRQNGDMMSQKINHPKSGANCAWVPCNCSYSSCITLSSSRCFF